MAALLSWVLAVPVHAAGIYQLGVSEQAEKGANWLVEYTYEDLTATTTNATVQTLTDFAIKAKMGIELVGVVLNTAFDTANTNFTGSLTLTIGDGTDADLFLESMELASDGTEVFLKLAASGMKVYTADDTIDFALTQSANEAATDNTSGKLRAYFRVWDVR